jgi:hypothetical protein
MRRPNGRCRRSWWPQRLFLLQVLTSGGVGWAAAVFITLGRRYH